MTVSDYSLFQIEKKRGIFIDDTAVNVVRLFCKQVGGGFLEVGNVTSSTFTYGDVWPKLYCPTDYWIVAYRVSARPSTCFKHILFRQKVPRKGLGAA